MTRSSDDPLSLFTNEGNLTTPIQEETSGGPIEIQGRGSIADGTLGGSIVNGSVEGGVRTRGRVRTRGGVQTRGTRASRRRRTDVTPSAYGNPSAFGFIPIKEEEEVEGGIRGQGRGHGRGRGRGQGPGRGRGRAQGPGRGRGRGRGRRHKEEEDAKTMIELRPETHNFCATNSNGSPGLDNSCANNPKETPEIGNSHATNCNGVGTTPVQSQINEGGTRSGCIATLHNTNMLECHICSKTLSIPIFQCLNGHTACSSCWLEFENKCTSSRCSLIGNIRNLGLEEVLEAVKITCSHSKYGCKETINYSMKHEHERSCAYEPCHCPLPDCGFNGSYKDFYLHFSQEHAASATCFKFDSSFTVQMGADMKYKFLQETDHTLFILNYGVRPYGDVANIIYIGPSCLQNEYSYELEASSGNSIKFSSSTTQSLPKWTACLPEKSCLVVTKDLTDCLWDHKFQVCIRRKR